MGSCCGAKDEIRPDEVRKRGADDDDDDVTYFDG